MGTALVFPVQVFLGLLTWGLLARWFLAPRIAGLPREVALQPLLAVQCVRYIGLAFLAPAATTPGLAQTFAVPAAIGTTVAGGLALIAIAALRAHSPAAVPVVWIQTIEGLADFANAFAQARAAGVVESLGAAYYVPIVIVPAAIVSHVMVLGLLLRRS